MSTSKVPNPVPSTTQIKASGSCPSSLTSQVNGPVSLTHDGTELVGAKESFAFDRAIESQTGSVLRSEKNGVRTFQVNVGLRCNLACHHCHVESSPKRTEEMSWDTMEMVLQAALLAKAKTTDITGGAPEMNPNFRRFVLEAVAQGHEVIVRTNLTIALEKGFEDLPEFFADCGVHLVASLPCYLELNVDKQRGKHVYTESVEVIKRLNAVGYGINPELPLDLVYNPLGGSLPPSQSVLESEYRRELNTQYGLHFSNLYTITNMPIGRFLHDLERSGSAETYMDTLVDAFNQETVESLMCRHQVHVSYDGTLHDCDFNYALKLGVHVDTEPSSWHIRDLCTRTGINRMLNRKIHTGAHCFACTAGCGSSCGGALA